jgi:hypothetical protein
MRARSGDGLSIQGPAVRLSCVTRWKQRVLSAGSRNIKAKTGKTPEEFKRLAEEKGLLKPGVKAGEIVAWLKEDFGLGHGHAMAIYATFKGKTE